MVIKNVYSVFFSPTGTTKKVINPLLEACRRIMNVWILHMTGGLTTKYFSRRMYWFSGSCLWGRIPEILESCMEAFQGNGAMCVPVVVYGNRAFDDALKELSDILEERGFSVAAAGALWVNIPTAEKLPEGVQMKRI